MKKLIIIALVSLISLHISAQKQRFHGDMEEKYHAQKVAYITTALDLSPQESAAFWPLYNEHEKKHNELMESMKNHRSDLLDNQDELTETDAREAILFIQKHRADMQSMEAAYQNKYLEVISAKKVLLLMKAEKDFRRELLKKLGERRGARGRY